MALMTDHVRETFLARLFDALPQSVTWSVPELDGSGRISDFVIRYANESGGIHIGVPREQLVGRGIFASVAMASAQRDRLWEQYLRVLQNGERVEDTYFDPIRNKYLHVVRTRVEEGVLTLATDVSAEQRALSDLRDQSAFTASILDASINAVYTNVAIRDASNEIIDFRIVQVNRPFEEIIGLPASAVIGNTLLAVFPGADVNGFLENARAVVETGRPWRELVHYEDERMYGWFDISLTKLNDGFVGTFTDVTALHEQQHKLEDYARQLEGILNGAQTKMLVLVPEWNEDGVHDYRVRMVNKAYADFKNTTPQELLNRKASTIFPAPHLDKIFAHYKQAVDTRESTRFDLHCDDPGRIFWLEVQVAPLGDDLLVTINDYTRMRLLQLELEQKVTELERSNRNLEEFAYAASHDLKEPIRKVRFFIDRLKQHYEPEGASEAARNFARLDVATERMRDLVDDLLAYAQVSLRPQRLDDVSLEAVLRTVLVDLELELEQQGGTLEIGSLPSVRGHQRQLHQLFQNLVGNALKYHRHDVPPLIRVSAKLVSGWETGRVLSPEKAARQYHLISVTDNGIGFEPSEAERIFQVFQRLHGNSEYRGTGVGLSIARKVTENHDGFIYAEGRPGEGATFHIALPA